MAVRDIDHPSGQPLLIIALVIVAIVIAAVASLYLVQMPGTISSMLTSLMPF